MKTIYLFSKSKCVFTESVLGFLTDGLKPTTLTSLDLVMLGNKDVPEVASSYLVVRSVPYEEGRVSNEACDF